MESPLTVLSLNESPLIVLSLNESSLTETDSASAPYELLTALYNVFWPFSPETGTAAIAFTVIIMVNIKLIMETILLFIKKLLPW